MDRAGSEWVRVEVRADKLRHLVNEGLACAADFRCLDARSKEYLWQFCLDSCRACSHFKDWKDQDCMSCANTPCGVRTLLMEFGSGGDKGVC